MGVERGDRHAAACHPSLTAPHVSYKQLFVASGGEMLGTECLQYQPCEYVSPSWSIDKLNSEYLLLVPRFRRDEHLVMLYGGSSEGIATPSRRHAIAYHGFAFFPYNVWFMVSGGLELSGQIQNASLGFVETGLGAG